MSQCLEGEVSSRGGRMVFVARDAVKNLRFFGSHSVFTARALDARTKFTKRSRELDAAGIPVSLETFPILSLCRCFRLLSCCRDNKPRESCHSIEIHSVEFFDYWEGRKRIDLNNKIVDSKIHHRRGMWTDIIIFVTHPVVPTKPGFAPRKSKNMDNVARSVSRIIYWIERGGTSSTKGYNDLKQRLMKIGRRNLAYIRLFDYNKSVRNNCSNYDTFVNNIIRCNVVLFTSM